MLSFLIARDDMSTDGGGALVGLVRRAREDDLDGFEELFQLSWPRLRRRICGLVKGYARDPMSTAEDLTQDVLVRVWQSLRSLKDPAKWEGYLWRITINVVRNDFRKNRRCDQRTESLDPNLDSYPEKRSDPALQLLVEEILSPLTILEKAVLWMRVVERRTLTEIADNVGFAGTGRHVRARRVYLCARKKIVKQLEKLQVTVTAETVGELMKRWVN